jgi:uncharacterized protein (TIGR03435 family)
MGLCARKLCKTAVLVMLGMAATLPACAQGQVQGNNDQRAALTPASSGTSAAGKLAFDAASVRLSSRKGYLLGFDFLDPVSEKAPPNGGLYSWNLQLRWLIGFAYDLRSPQVARDAWQKLPEWAQAEWYTVEARAEGNPTRADVRQMVRSLLEERFQFAAHVEKREGQVYALEVGRPGLGLKPHPEGASCTLSSAQVDETRYPHAYPPYKAFPVRCGVFKRVLSHINESRFEMLNVTMQQIADSLGPRLPISVIDKTGLAGRYDAVLDFGPEQLPSNLDSSDELGFPVLQVALEKQLGLKLVKQNAPVDVFVIDHIGVLSEN